MTPKRAAKFASKEYRDGFMSETVRSWIVYQIRRLREERGWTQADLAEKMGTTQANISRFETNHIGSRNIDTLLDFAHAFDVALEVRFISWPEFIMRTEDLSEEAMSVPSFAPPRVAT